MRFHKSNLKSDEVEALVKRTRSALDVAGQSRIRSFDLTISKKLYEEFVQPFDALFSGKSHVIVSAAGALAQIPMGVLVSTEGKYWIQQTAITHVPSATAWLAVQRGANSPEQRAKEPFFGVGDPVFSSTQLAQAESMPSTPVAVRSIQITRTNSSLDLTSPTQTAVVTYSKLSPLPETRDEIRAIASALNANPLQDTLFGASANKAQVLQLSASGKLQNKRVISFATHGLVTGDLPNLNQPALALSVPRGFNEQDFSTENINKPLLTLEDVLGLKLNADWVVLSACNTAAADGKGEEALSGLARGFFYAEACWPLIGRWTAIPPPR